MIFDKSSFICRLENDELLEREIIALFLTQCPHLLEEIREAASQRDAARLERAAHTLKGSLGDMAAPCAFRCARALEDMGRKGRSRRFRESSVRFARIPPKVRA